VITSLPSAFILLLGLLTPGVSARGPVYPPVLPCRDPSPECLRRLGEIAVGNSLEIASLDRAIAYQKRKRWTVFINADGFTPAGIATRLARNLLGGGERAASRLEIDALDRRRAETEAALRLRVAEAAIDYETARRRHLLAESRLEAHGARAKIVEAGYRLGEGTTEAPLALWREGEDLRSQLAAAASEEGRGALRLRGLVFPDRPSAGISPAEAGRPASGRHSGRIGEVEGG